MTSEATPPTVSLKRRLVARPRLAGCALALVGAVASLGPSLLPRAAVVQGVLLGLDAAVFYGIGTAAAALLAAVRSRRGLPSMRTAAGWRVLAVLAPISLAFGLWRWVGQQDDQAQLVDGTAPGWGAIPVILVVGALVGALLLAIGRIVGHLVAGMDRRLGRRLPQWAAHAISGAVAAVGIFAVVSLFVVDPIKERVNTTFGTLDDTTAEGVEQPTVPEQSGGPGSLAPWDTLGLQGRTFAGGATSQEDLEATAAPDLPVVEPIRVYAGLRSADTPHARAELAVDELVRTGGLDRPVLIIATTTGTGWINPNATEALERLWNGNTAVVGQQYSYLPSWISFLVDADKASETGEALIDAVAERWRQLPESDRPRLIVFGESLGSLGSEAALVQGSASSSIAHIAATADGVLWVGPPDANPIHAQLTAEREPGSPVWRPEIAGGEVGFANGADELGQPDGLTIQYLQHASDPVVWWDWQTMWRRPEWLAEPRGADVPSSTRWVPFVTWSQTVADLAAGFSAGRGFGHNYDDAWTQAWLAVAPPPSAEPDRVAAIEAALADEPG